MKLNELHKGIPTGLSYRALTPSDVMAFDALRLQALHEYTHAYGATFDEEHNTPLEIISDRLEPTEDRVTIGVFWNRGLVAIACVARDKPPYKAHKGGVWDVYVTPERRGMGIGRSLMAQVIYHARLMPGIIQLSLFVDAENFSAIKLYEAVGFGCCGMEPNAILTNGIFRDVSLLVCRL